MINNNISVSYTMSRPLYMHTGIYSRSKYKVLALLDTVNGKQTYLNTKLIAIYTGIDYFSLISLLRRYTNYRYIHRHDYSRCYEYAITTKGYIWLVKAGRGLQNAGTFAKELSEQIINIKPYIDVLLNLPFKQFVKAVKCPALCCKS